MKGEQREINKEMKRKIKKKEEDESTVCVS